MSINIDSLSTYLNSIEAVSSVLNQSPASQSATDATGSTDKDSYVSTIGDTNAVLPSDTYNDIINQIKASAADTSSGNSGSESQESASSSGTASSTEAASSDSSVSGASGGSGGSGGSSSESDSTTEIVTINGVAYLQTTTTTDGVESVTRVPISAAAAQENVSDPSSANQTSAMEAMSPAVEALGGM